MKLKETYYEFNFKESKHNDGLCRKIDAYNFALDFVKKNKEKQMNFDFFEDEEEKI